jgi:hypothetical protein
MANETSTLEDKETVRAETLQVLQVWEELTAVVDDVVKTQFHELAENIPFLTQRLQRIAAASPDKTILNQTRASSTLQFAENVLVQIDTLKTFGPSGSTWQLLQNDSKHRAYTTGGRAKFLRQLCTVETALMILEHANMEPLKLTGNFVVDNTTVIQHVQENLWHLRCDRSRRLPKIRDDLPLRYEKARAKTNAGLLIVNGFELSESWPASIHEYQLRSVGNNATVEDCEAYKKGWVDLIYSEKIRQRVNKGLVKYTFDADNLHLPWDFVNELGIATLPMVIWVKQTT